MWHCNRVAENNQPEQVKQRNREALRWSAAWELTLCSCSSEMGVETMKDVFFTFLPGDGRTGCSWGLTVQDNWHAVNHSAVGRPCRDVRCYACERSTATAWDTETYNGTRKFKHLLAFASAGKSHKTRFTRIRARLRNQTRKENNRLKAGMKQQKKKLFTGKCRQAS